MSGSSNNVLPYRAFAELPAERHLAVRFHGDGFTCIRTFRKASDHQIDRHVLIRFRDLRIHALAVSRSTCESDVNRVGRNQRPGFPGLGLRCDQVIARREQWWTGSAVASRSAQPVGTTGAGNATGAGSAGSAGSAGMCGRAARRSMAAATAATPVARAAVRPRTVRRFVTAIAFVSSVMLSHIGWRHPARSSYHPRNMDPSSHPPHHSIWTSPIRDIPARCCCHMIPARVHQKILYRNRTR